MNSQQRESLHALLSAVVDATASEQQVSELAALLQSSAEARQFYVRYIDMHAALTSGQLSPAAMKARTPPWGLIVASLMAASLLVAWFVVPPLWRGGVRNPAAGSAATAGNVTAACYVATIASASADAILDGKAVMPGSRLTRGAYLLTAGGVNIRFDGGARILLEGATRFAIDSRRVMRIHEGTFVFQGDQTCESIEIVTPHSIFRNIGTRYAAVIDARREEVHVAEGAVRRTPGSASESNQHELIEAGIGRRYGAADATAESIPLDGELVTRSLEPGGAGAATREPVAWDDFRGDTTVINGLKSGAGWGGPWESRRGSLLLVSPGLSGDAGPAVVHDGRGKGGGKDSAEWKAAAHRRLASPIDLSTDGIWYVRFLVRRGRVSPRDEHRAMVVLRPRGLSAEQELERSPLIQIALRKHDGVLLRVGDTLTRASLPQLPDQEYAVVAKIVAGRSQPDQVLLSLMAADRLDGSSEPAEWSLVSEDVDSDLRFEKLSLEFSSSGHVAIGGLCIGPTWESVAQPRDH